MRGSRPKMVRRQRRLRRDATDAEMRIWLALRDRRLGGYKFVRQDEIGPYIVDFVCRDRRLVIEIEASTPKIRGIKRGMLSSSGKATKS